LNYATVHKERREGRVVSIVTAAVPVPMLLGQLALTLLLPTLSGMVVRRSFPELTEHRRHLLFGMGLVALAALIGLVLA
jgi:predicted Na+-dependent transporter